MRRRFFIMILILALLVGPVHGAEDYIKWVDFNVSYEAMDKALALDIRSQEQDMPVSWIDSAGFGCLPDRGEGDGKTCGTGLSGFADRSEPSGAFGRAVQILFLLPPGL